MATLTSEFSPTQSVTLVPEGWFLKDPVDTSRQMQLPIKSVEFSSEIDQAVFNPLGRTRNVVVQDVSRGEVLSLTLAFTTQEQYDAFELLRKSIRTLLLQSDMPGQQWYVRSGATRSTVLFNNAARLTAPYRETSIEFIEVDEP